MGLLNFLKPKKGKDDFSVGMPDFGSLPQMTAPDQSQPTQNTDSDSELYSDLPNLPDAPDTLGLPEIELPPPINENLDDSAFQEQAQTKMPFKKEVMPSPAQKQPDFDVVEPLLPNWPKMQSEEKKLPEIPDIPTQAKPQPRQEIPPATPYVPQAEPKIINNDDKYFLRSEDYRKIRSHFLTIAQGWKKHHKLTELKKIENDQYEKINLIVEDMQRKLMHVDKTLFE